MAMTRVLVCDALPAAAVEKLKNAGLEADVRTGLAPEALVAAIGPYHGVIVRSATKITKDVIVAGKNLKVIGRAGVGLDNVDAAAAKERGIMVVNTPSATAISVAELAIGLMLALARKIPAAHAKTATGVWDKKSFEGIELAGKTLGLVGLGSIAKETAKRARALGMQVICHRKDPKKVDPEARLWEIEVVALDALLARADFVSLHIPLTADTKNLIGAAQLAKMKKGAFLVNCARGGVVDEQALAEALKSGRLAGAAVDVFSKEPVEAANPLLAAPNVILTPHVGASTAEGQLRAGTEIADLVIQHLAK